MPRRSCGGRASTTSRSLPPSGPMCRSASVGGRARVTGIGEVVEPLPFVPCTYTIITPPFGVSTAEVYRVWDTLAGP